MILEYGYVYPDKPHTQYLIYSDGGKFRYTKSIKRGPEEHITDSDRLIKMDEFFKSFIK